MEMRTNADKSLDLSAFNFHTFLCNFFTFLNACISDKTSLINTKLGDFGNLGVLFLTMGINIVPNPIIYRLVPGPSRYEIRQLSFVATSSAKP